MTIFHETLNFNCNPALQNMNEFWIKRTKEQECWIKLNQDLRGMVKVFSILASKESLVLTLNCF